MKQRKARGEEKEREREIAVVAYGVLSLDWPLLIRALIYTHSPWQRGELARAPKVGLLSLVGDLRACVWISDPELYSSLAFYVYMYASEQARASVYIYIYMERERESG